MMRADTGEPTRRARSRCKTADMTIEARDRNILIASFRSQSVHGEGE